MTLEYLSAPASTEYERFVQSNKKGHFMQSSLWAAQKTLWKWTAVIARDADGKICGTLAVLIRKVPYTPFTFMYGCRGPVCDIDNEAVLDALIKGAKQLAKENRSFALRLDPDIVSPDEGFAKHMKQLGFRFVISGKNFESIQPRYVFRLNISGKTEDEIMAGFKSKWRYNIRLAERKGLEVHVCGKEMIPAFSTIMQETGRRDGFIVRDQNYFSNMLDNFGKHARLFMAFYDGAPIAGSIAICYGDKTWYLYGASSESHRELMPNYLLQWRMICWAVENECRIYDFRGVSGDLSESNPLYGLYRFKQGFGGDFTEFIGEMDLIFNCPLYFSAKTGVKIIRRLRNKKAGRK